MDFKCNLTLLVKPRTNQITKLYNHPKLRVNKYKMMTDTEEDIICDCTGTTCQKVQQLIDDGATTLDEVADATGVTTGCGACDILVVEMLEA